MKKFAGSNSGSLDPAVDVVLMILKAATATQPGSTLLTSFLRQYQERGGLSKKQLEGLHSKAKKIPGMSAAHLATLEAIILKKPNRYKSDTPTPSAEIKPDTDTPAIADILQKYPSHKRVLFFKNKIENGDRLTMQESDELKKFGKLLLTGKNNKI